MGGQEDRNPRESIDDGECLETVWRALRVISLYGVLRFITDIDGGRDFTAGGNDPTITSAVLEWAATEGFSEVMREIDPRLDYRSAREFRERYVLGALKSIGEALSGR